VSATVCEAVPMRRRNPEGACYWCKRKRPMKLYRVKPHTPRYKTQTWSRYVEVVAVCADAADCRAYRNERLEKSRQRSGSIEWRCSRFQRIAGKGECHWCGDPIVLADPADYRRRSREYHRGDEHEVGDKDCKSERDWSVAMEPRSLIQLREDPCCVDCGSEGGNWDADHDKPLWDGGEHSATNLVRRCGDCHKKKTAREAAERASRRRSARPSTQQQLVAA
jgi:HNH endonuclease